MSRNKNTKQDLRDSITKELGEFVKSKASTFACGGSIPVNSIDVDTPVAPPISLRWDSANSANGIAKLNFPINSADEGHKTSLIKLINDCQPASFGYKGENVLDESYRKATKMDRSVFSVDFCPYELGIVDTIAQMLLPNAGTGAGTKGVKAELYKLNIYGAPSGFFKAHVDTPRSDTQFGSLVVSLPCHHEGGQLIVRHAEQSVTFDWSASGSSEKVDTAVQWAAFYSDCEHEVLEVTEGYRITLTYNLYYVPGVGDLAGNSPAMDVKSLPLYRRIQEALGEPTFMADGGHLGVFCQHAYAHSTPEGIKSLPGVLKGSDMAVYTVFLALGLGVAIRPVFDLKESGYFKYYCDEDDGEIAKGKDFVGVRLDEVKVTEVGGYEEPEEEVLKYLGGKWLKVNWLTEPVSKNVNFVHLTYGNEAGINHVYTHAALIVTVPPATQRTTPEGAAVSA